MQRTVGLAAKSEGGQVNTFVYMMGDEVDDILSSLAEDDKNKYVWHDQTSIWEQCH